MRRPPVSPTVRASGWMCAYFQWWHMPSMKNRVESSGRDCIRITARFLGGYARCADLFGWPMKPDRPGSGWPGLADAQIECVVAAPSKLIRPAGDRVKTDARDAAHLARLLHLGQVTEVTIPSIEQEAARDLVRAREDVRGDLMTARHRLSKLLLRQGIVYSGGKAWTGVHDRWLRTQRFESSALPLTYETVYETMLAA